MRVATYSCSYSSLSTLPCRDLAAYRMPSRRRRSIFSSGVHSLAGFARSASSAGVNMVRGCRRGFDFCFLRRDRDESSSSESISSSSSSEIVALLTEDPDGGLGNSLLWRFGMAARGNAVGWGWYGE